MAVTTISDDSRAIMMIATAMLSRMGVVTATDRAACIRVKAAAGGWCGN